MFFKLNPGLNSFMILFMLVEIGPAELPAEMLLSIAATVEIDQSESM